ncbi:uncharacterized protein N7479_004452 [Penicillium vulpinum]|uniref:NAD-dependent epimerase/dehydratase domain-containing protein n=1 Tax=Penicillium vulpinum TaxID=29845 RepID=A0A1V6SD16_9EURO|nr:uncharacterized protein N7479_004452 [Penicillium vulpinum]KAJ5964576.1 hypothetical protein N7479_004452 [Penicillium vulpinum]OQE11808.1 hypothetical protein PENVUL_c002G06582 [Penicillium vulpinum]
MASYLGVARSFDLEIVRTLGQNSANDEYSTETMEVNVEVVYNVTLAFLPLLREGNRKMILSMSSITGSLAHEERFMIVPHHAYKISKAALNSITKLHALDLSDEGFTFCAVSPGWLRVDQAGPYANLNAEICAKAVLDLLERYREALNGKFLNIYVPGWEEIKGLHKYDGLTLNGKWETDVAYMEHLGIMRHSPPPGESSTGSCT